MSTDRRSAFPNPYPTAPPEMERILITEPLAAQDAENLARAEHIAAEVLELAGLQNMPAEGKSDEQLRRERDLIAELPDAELQTARTLSAAAEPLEAEAQQISTEISQRETVRRQAMWQGSTNLASITEAQIVDLRTRLDGVATEGAGLFAQTQEKVVRKLYEASPNEVTLDPVAFWSTDGTATKLPEAIVERTPSVMDTVDPTLVRRVAELEATIRSLKGEAEEPEPATADEDPSPTGAPADRSLPVGELFAGDDFVDATDDETQVPTWDLPEPTGGTLVAADTDGLGASGSFTGQPRPQFMPTSPPPAPEPEPRPVRSAPEPDSAAPAPGVFDGTIDDGWASFAPTLDPEEDPWAASAAIDPFAPSDADRWGEPDPADSLGDDDIPPFLRDDPPLPAAAAPLRLVEPQPSVEGQPSLQDQIAAAQRDIQQAFKAAWQKPEGISDYIASQAFKAAKAEVGQLIGQLPPEEQEAVVLAFFRELDDLETGRFDWGDDEEKASSTVTSSTPDRSRPPVVARRTPPARRTLRPRRPRRRGDSLSPRD